MAIATLAPFRICAPPSDREDILEKFSSMIEPIEPSVKCDGNLVYRELPTRDSWSNIKRLRYTFASFFSYIFPFRHTVTQLNCSGEDNIIYSRVKCNLFFLKFISFR